MYQNSYCKKRLRKCYMPKEEYEKITTLISSTDFESQILGLSILQNSKTVKHYRKWQKFNKRDLTDNFQDWGSIVYIDIHDILQSVINIIQKYQLPLRDLYSYVIYPYGYKIQNLKKELDLWFKAHCY